MAIRLSKAFGSTPETWLGMQMAYDLWQARKRARQIKVESFAAVWGKDASPKSCSEIARVIGGPRTWHFRE